MGEKLDRLTVTVLAEDSVGYELSLLGQHGISLLLEAELGSEKRTVLMDVGQNHKALRFNMDELGVDPRSIDAVVITHCHYDHTGGLTELVRAVGKTDFPVIAHPDTFRPHFVNSPFLRHVGVRPEDSREKLEETGAFLYLTRDPFSILPGLRTTGEVPRETAFEEPGIALSTIQNSRVVDDLVMDDISLAAELRDQGLVVLTGCSHAGIVNIVRHAQKITGETRLEGIVGGFHLIEADKQRIAKTVDALADMSPNWIAAGHCTGFQAQVALNLTFGDRFTPLYTGIRLVV